MPRFWADGRDLGGVIALEIIKKIKIYANIPCQAG
jgi:hypothetical protein